MPKSFEPDGQFVDKLEWQLSSEFRRTSRLKPAAGRVAVPRWVVAFSLVAGVLLMGVAAIKASDSIKGAWRKKIEDRQAGDGHQAQKGLPRIQEGVGLQGRDAGFAGFDPRG